MRANLASNLWVLEDVHTLNYLWLLKQHDVSTQGLHDLRVTEALEDRMQVMHGMSHLVECLAFRHHQIALFVLSPFLKEGLHLPR